MPLSPFDRPMESRPGYFDQSDKKHYGDGLNGQASGVSLQHDDSAFREALERSNKKLDDLLREFFPDMG